MNKKILDLIFNDYEYEDVIERSFHKSESFEVDDDELDDYEDLDDFDDEIEEDNDEGLDDSSDENSVN